MLDTRKAARMRRMNGTLRAVGYARVSTEHQVDGLSFGAQRAGVELAVAGHDWELVDVVAERASGKSISSRPVLCGLLDALAAGEYDVLVVTRLDRLSRSPRDFYELMDRAKREGWAILCLSPDLDMTTTTGRAVAGMAMVFAEFERGLSGDRQRESIAARKRAGTYRSPPRLISSDAEERIAFLAGEGMGPRRIARQLELEGFSPPASRKWYPTSVARIAARQRAA